MFLCVGVGLEGRAPEGGARLATVASFRWEITEAAGAGVGAVESKEHTREFCRTKAGMNKRRGLPRTEALASL